MIDAKISLKIDWQTKLGHTKFGLSINFELIHADSCKFRLIYFQLFLLTAVITYHQLTHLYVCPFYKKNDKVQQTQTNCTAFFSFGMQINQLSINFCTTLLQTREKATIGREFWRCWMTAINHGLVFYFNLKHNLPNWYWYARVLIINFTIKNILWF